MSVSALTKALTLVCLFFSINAVISRVEIPNLGRPDLVLAKSA